jgi:hypothetical protein
MPPLYLLYLVQLQRINTCHINNYALPEAKRSLEASVHSYIIYTHLRNTFGIIQGPAIAQLTRYSTPSAIGPNMSWP